MKLTDIPQTCFYSWCVAMAFRYVHKYITEQEIYTWSAQAHTHTHTHTPFLHFLQSIKKNNKVDGTLLSHTTLLYD